MAKDKYIHIGTTGTWSPHPFGLIDRDIFQHILINGQTGSGKSSLMRSIYAQIVQYGLGCTLIDLNGDLSKDCLEDIRPVFRNRVVYIDPTDTEHVLPINPFYRVPTDKISKVADDFVKNCKAIWKDSWGERMDWYLYNITAAVLHAPEELNPTILSINLMLGVPNYRSAVLKHVKDPEIIRFFKTEFNKLTPTKRKEVIMPIENKIGKFVANPYVRNMLSPYEPSFQIKDAIAKRSIVILRLPKGTLGETAAQLLGSMTVSTLINSAQEQDSLPEKKTCPALSFS